MFPEIGAVSKCSPSATAAPLASSQTTWLSLPAPDAWNSTEETPQDDSSSITNESPFGHVVGQVAKPDPQTYPATKPPPAASTATVSP